MAARENQGLQIALIIFVMLTIMLSVTTFIFFRNYQDEQLRTKTAEAKTAEITNKFADLQGERDIYIKHLGFPETEKDKQVVIDAWTKDMAAAAAFGIKDLPADQQHYRKLVEAYAAVVRAQNESLAGKDVDLREAVSVFSTKQREFETEKDKLAQEKAKVVQEYLDERKRIADELALLMKSKNQLTGEKVAKDKAFEEMKTQLEAKLNAVQKDITKAQADLVKVQEKNRTIEQEFTVDSIPDGKIVWVNARDNIAYINLGTADRLKKRITFSVHEPNATDVKKAAQKGSIEVINVSERNMAECRILESSTSNPLLPGDVIFTPVWSPGQQDRFALGGFLDIDGDGIEDKQRVRDLISLNGGIVDAETDADGKLVGDVTVETRYVVLGEIKPEKKNDGTYAMLDKAKKYNVETMPLTKFTELMGYTVKASEGELRPGEGPRSPTPGEPRDQFKPRSPPQRTSRTTAF